MDQSLGQKYFVWFLVQMSTGQSAFEIYWPLKDTNFRLNSIYKRCETNWEDTGKSTILSTFNMSVAVPQSALKCRFSANLLLKS